MLQQLLHPSEVKTRPHKMDCKAVPERVGVDVDVDHAAVLLDEGVNLTPFDAKNRPIFSLIFFSVNTE